MKTELIEKANNLLVEIKELQGYKKMLMSRNQGNTVHFQIVQHYGVGVDRIIIDRRHNIKLLGVVDKIIAEIENEMELL